MPDGQLITPTQFQNSFLNKVGRYIVHVPVTKTYDNDYGQETLTDGTPEVIHAIFMRMSQKWTFDKMSDIEGGDAYVLVKGEVNLNHDDYIYAEGTRIELSSIDGNTTTISITSSSAHGLSAGDHIFIANTTNYNGVYTVATVPTTTTLTIADTIHNLAAETSGNLFRDYNKFLVKDLIKVPGKFGSTEEIVYHYANLFLYSEAD